MREQDGYVGNTSGHEAVLQRARDAQSRGDWDEAFDLYMKADAGALLSTADLPVLAEVAYAAGHLDVTIEAWERAHALSVQSGDEVAAGGAAVRVAMHLLMDTALMAPVRGWLGRAERLLEGHGETSAHAWFAVARTYERMLTGDLRSARDWAGRAVEIGSKCDPAARAIGRVAEARLLILAGDVRARVRAAGTRPVRRGRGVDRRDGTVVQDERDREPPRTLQGSSRRDPQVARVVRRSRKRGARGV